MASLFRLIRRDRSRIRKLIVFGTLSVFCLMLTISMPTGIGRMAYDDRPDHSVGGQASSGNPPVELRYNTTGYSAVTPIASTNPHPFRVLISPRNLCDGPPSGSLLAIIYVHSRPDGAWTRHVIRRTWGNVTRFSGSIGIVFVLGTVPQDPSFQLTLMEEALRYNDILQENFIDSYKNLTYKAIAALKWISSNCLRPPYVIKVDDDVMVDTFSLIRVLRDLESARRSAAPDQLWCRVWNRMRVQRTGKWRVDPGYYQHDFYPTYCSGMAYIMTSKTARNLYQASYEMPFFWIDDVYVTGLLARKAAVRHTDLQYFFVLQPDLMIKERNRLDRVEYTPMFAHSSSQVIDVVSLWESILASESLIGKAGKIPEKGEYLTTAFTGRFLLVGGSTARGTTYQQKITPLEGSFGRHQSRYRSVVPEM